jgi:septal ring factor EnvC (AmiA/AmiB activator)
METRGRIQKHERANRETEEHLRRMEEFLAQSQKQLEALREGVARTREHMKGTSRFIEHSNCFLEQLRQQRGRGA